MEGPVSRASRADASRVERLGRVLASPAGVLVLLPTLVVAAGLVTMLLGRRATRDASDSMARRQLALQAADVQHDVAFALDQAVPLFASLRGLARPDLPIEDVAPRMRDLVIGRPGVANVSISFPTGVMRGTFVDPASGTLQVQESQVGSTGTTRTEWRLDGGVRVAGTRTTTYDPRKRPHWALATRARHRAWLPPRTFFTSHKTGLTVTEPIYAADGALQAVTTVDFDVTALSSFLARPPLEGARTVMFTADGTILAFPAVPLPAVATRENRLLRHEDFADPALEALFAHLGTPAAGIEFRQLATADGNYLVSIAPVGGRRAGIDAPLAWYLATLVPERVLLGPTHRLARQGLLASGGALAIAVGLALMFAWNLLRMRRAVGRARARARSAEARARELGSYRLVARLGEGGMGEVWRAEHRLLARQAAIKLVRPDALTDPTIAPAIRERFRREAQTLASMRSLHTIELYDYGVTDEGTFYFVMELLDGVDLDRLVRRHGALPAGRVLHLLVQACQSLAEAHEAGLLHRDIKPANLFVCRRADEVDVLKVLDFGIVHSVTEGFTAPEDVVRLPPPPTIDPATGDAVTTGPVASGPLTKAGALIGTPGYIAPDLVHGATLDARADIYALGCVAWWLLTGSEVFTGTDEDDAIRAHVEDPVPALRPRVRGWLPSELEAIVLACLAKEPADRPPHASALMEALRAIPVPPEHAWTEAHAAAWWREHFPAAAPGDAPDAPPGASERLLVAAPDAAARPAGVSEARTVAARPSERTVAARPSERTPRR